jgi:hypothetical protein
LESSHSLLLMMCSLLLSIPVSGFLLMMSSGQREGAHFAACNSGRPFLLQQLVDLFVGKVKRSMASRGKPSRAS